MKTIDEKVDAAKRMNIVGRRDAAELRVRNALALIERAQNDLGSACAELSAIVGAVPEWKKASKLHDACHDFWRNVAYHPSRGKQWMLDRDPVPVAVSTYASEESEMDEARRKVG